MATRHRHSKRARLAKGLRSRKMLHTIKSSFGLVAFLQQITSKDSASYSTKPIGERLQSFANNVTGRMLGLNIFSGQGIPKYQQTFNTTNLVNPWTKIGAAAIGLNIINGFLPAKVKIPLAGKIGAVGKWTFIGGLAGAIFDAPAHSSVSSGSNQIMISNGQSNGSVL